MWHTVLLWSAGLLSFHRRRR
ncbi:MAG: MprA protease, GlyGly-CTERM protein-sorting domain-containing form [Fibrobacter sp.]|nr:MprA protease, GlyGly-CTERM protein-sorting domain-containing form [Fibrobacter sp.]